MSESVAQDYASVADIPIEEIDVSRADLFQSDTHWEYFARLRKEAPVHYCKDSLFGPYWSLTRFNDIMAMEKNFQDFSSDSGIVLGDRPADFETANFIGMDPPKHDAQRKTVQGVVAPMNLAKLEGTIRSRAETILDSLPIGKTFNWVDLVSVELTTQMLATIFDFPFAERHKLTYWSDMATSGELGGGPTPEPVRRAALLECLEYFTKLRDERATQPVKSDLLSMLAHGKDTQNMPSMEFLGNLILLIVGGNDTTRNSMSGGIAAFNKYPEQLARVKADKSLLPGMVSEIIRWQSPVAHMCRTAMEDVEVGGKLIKKWDKVAIWYASGNRDTSMFPNANDLIIDRKDVRQHLSFGFGIHRCLGNRLADLQLKILWEEILNKFSHIEVTGEQKFLSSSFIRGITELPVKVHRY